MIAIDSKWKEEKEGLLRTHPGWLVAYQDGNRVALEPSADALVATLDKALGENRQSCTFYEIVEQPEIGRGPSPRYWPMVTVGIKGT